jgi:hypothetical protein
VSAHRGLATTARLGAQGARAERAAPPAAKTSRFTSFRDFPSALEQRVLADALAPIVCAEALGQ